MKRKLVGILLMMVMLFTTSIGCSKEPVSQTGGDVATPAAPAAEGDKYKVYLITMDQMDQHWVNLDRGCKEAAAEFDNVEYTWLAPDVKDDAKQIESINNAVAGGADAIILAANGPDAVTATLEEAVADGVKIVYVDSPANFDGEATFTTDNEAAGKTAGNILLDKLKENNVASGDIGIINTNAASTSTVLREQGFKSAFEGSEFKILETQYGEGDAAKSKDIAANYITAGVVGIFGTNEGSSVGVGNAVQESDGSGVIGVGFDKSDALLELIKNEHLLACMAQNPDVMGYEGMKAAVAVLQGEDLGGAVQDTGVSVITVDNVADFK